MRLTPRRDRREIEALKHTKYEEGNSIFFIFPDDPDKRDWEETKKIYQSQGKKIFYKVIKPQYWIH